MFEPKKQLGPVSGSKARRVNRKVLGLVVALVLIVSVVLSIIGYRLGTYVRTNLSEYPSVYQAQVALRQRPNDAMAHRTLAQAFFQGREYDASISEWRRVVKLQPENRSAKSYLAAALIQAGRRGEAIATLTELSQKNDAYGRNARITLRHVLSRNPPGRIRPPS